MPQEGAFELIDGVQKREAFYVHFCSNLYKANVIIMLLAKIGREFMESIISSLGSQRFFFFFFFPRSTFYIWCIHLSRCRINSSFCSCIQNVFFSIWPQSRKSNESPVFCLDITCWAPWLDFTVSEHGAPQNFSQSTALPERWSNFSTSREKKHFEVDSSSMCWTVVVAATSSQLSFRLGKPVNVQLAISQKVSGIMGLTV